MAYSKIRQPKLSDVIEQQLEFLILEGTLRPGEKLPPERELAKQFDVSRPSLREAIQRLEAKGLLLRRQGGGTFVQSSLWQSFSDPLVELLSDHPESQFDLLETRHALEGIAAYYAALRSTDEDKDRIRELHHAIELAQESGDLDAESEAVLQYQIAVTDVDPIETRDWLQAIESVIREEGVERAQYLIDQLLSEVRKGGVKVAAGAGARSVITSTLLPLKTNRNTRAIWSWNVAFVLRSAGTPS